MEVFAFDFPCFWSCVLAPTTAECWKSIDFQYSVFMRGC